MNVAHSIFTLENQELSSRLLQFNMPPIEEIRETVYSFYQEKVRDYQHRGLITDHRIIIERDDSHWHGRGLFMTLEVQQRQAMNEWHFLRVRISLENNTRQIQFTITGMNPTIDTPHTLSREDIRESSQITQQAGRVVRPNQREPNNIIINDSLNSGDGAPADRFQRRGNSPQEELRLAQRFFERSYTLENTREESIRVERLTLPRPFNSRNWADRVRRGVWHNMRVPERMSVLEREIRGSRFSELEIELIVRRLEMGNEERSLLNSRLNPDTESTELLGLREQILRFDPDFDRPERSPRRRTEPTVTIYADNDSPTDVADALRYVMGNFTVGGREANQERLRDQRPARIEIERSYINDCWEIIITEPNNSAIRSEFTDEYVQMRNWDTANINNHIDEIRETIQSQIAEHRQEEAIPSPMRRLRDRFSRLITGTPEEQNIHPLVSGEPPIGQLNLDGAVSVESLVGHDPMPDTWEVTTLDDIVTLDNRRDLLRHAEMVGIDCDNFEETTSNADIREMITNQLRESAESNYSIAGTTTGRATSDGARLTVEAMQEARDAINRGRGAQAQTMPRGVGAHGVSIPPRVFMQPQNNLSDESIERIQNHIRRNISDGDFSRPIIIADDQSSIDHFDIRVEGYLPEQYKLPKYGHRKMILTKEKKK